MLIFDTVTQFVSGWCRHGFESHSQSFLLTYFDPEADLSLLRLVFYFHIYRYFRKALKIGFIFFNLSSLEKGC